MARKRASRSGSRSQESRRRPAAAEPGWAVFLEEKGFWVAAASLALLLLVFFHPLFFQGKTFQPPDQIHSVAHTTFVQEAFAEEGSFFERYPLWTPYIFSGMPTFGSMTAAPYTNLLSLVLFWVPAWWKVVAYYFVAGILTWIFLRRNQCGSLVSLFGALAFVFCAHVITWIMFGHNTKPSTIAFLPVVLLATEEIWERPTLRWGSLLALSVTFMLLCHHYQVAYYILLASGLYLILALIRTGRSLGLARIAGRLATWAAGIGVGFAGSAMLFLPVREYAAYSIRGGEGGGLTFSYATNWSFHPLEMATFFVPSFAGFGAETYWGWMPFNDFPHYMGILVLLLAKVTGLTWYRHRLVLFLVTLSMISLVLAFGKHLPVLYGPFFEFFPYFDKFRVPSMILMLTQFGVAMLAAFGLQRILTAPPEDRERLRRRVILVAGIFAGIVVVLGGIVAAGLLEGTIAPRLARKFASQGTAQSLQIGARLAERVAAMAGRDLVMVLLVLGGGTAILLARLRGRLGATATVLGILGLTLLDLWRVDFRPMESVTYPRTGNDAFEPTPAVQYLQQQAGPYRILPFTGEARNNNWFAYFRIPSILGYHPAKIRIYQDLIDEEGPAGVYKSLGRGNFNIVNMLNMKYVVADQEITGGPLVPVHRSHQFVMENRGVLPRLWFVDRARVVSDPQLHLQAVADPSWNPAQEAIVFEDLGELDPGGGGSARIAGTEMRRLTAEVDSPGRSLLVWSEVFYPPGWRAFIDGEPAEIHRVNYVLRGIVVPPGTHTVEMRLVASTIRTGLLITAGALLLTLLALAASFLPRRKGGDEAVGSASA